MELEFFFMEMCSCKWVEVMMYWLFIVIFVCVLKRV